LHAGDIVEAFDDAGATAQATLRSVTPRQVTLHVDQIKPAAAPRFTWTVAAAVPKGPRADWMVEKLSELGATAFIPLTTARSVTAPSGAGKIDRWIRLAAESAKQSRRAGVMRIDPLTPVAQVVGGAEAVGGINPGHAAWYFSPNLDAIPISRLTLHPRPQSLLMLIGPEGGWTDQEIALFQNANMIAVKLTDTVLRVETAALAAAVLAAVWQK
jgi:16S rRNA (uracil1498-N3)-methyltransferase